MRFFSSALLLFCSSALPLFCSSALLLFCSSHLLNFSLHPQPSIFHPLLIAHCFPLTSPKFSPSHLPIFSLCPRPFSPSPQPQPPHHPHPGSQSCAPRQRHSPLWSPHALSCYGCRFWSFFPTPPRWFYHRWLKGNRSAVKKLCANDDIWFQ